MKCFLWYKNCQTLYKKNLASSPTYQVISLSIFMYSTKHHPILMQIKADLSKYDTVQLLHIHELNIAIFPKSLDPKSFIYSFDLPVILMNQ